VNALRGIATALGCALVACGPKPAVELTLERTECFGGCPAYLVEIHGNGRVDYTGGSFVLQTGHRGRRLPESVVRDLVDEFEQSGFFEFEDEYGEHPTDYSAIFLSVRIGDRRKRVESYWTGAHNDGFGQDVPDSREPEAIDKLAASIERAVEIEKWIGTREERDQLRRRR
jgi:hypothetical protein